METRTKSLRVVNNGVSKRRKRRKSECGGLKGSGQPGVQSECVDTTVSETSPQRFVFRARGSPAYIYLFFSHSHFTVKTNNFRVQAAFTPMYFFFSFFEHRLFDRCSVSRAAVPCSQRVRALTNRTLGGRV